MVLLLVVVLARVLVVLARVLVVPVVVMVVVTVVVFVPHPTDYLYFEPPNPSEY